MTIPNIPTLQPITAKVAMLSDAFLAEAEAIKTGCCQRCGDDDFSPNVEAFEISGEILCDECAKEIFQESSQFGVGA